MADDLVSEYRQLPPHSDSLGDTSPNWRKCRILELLDERANDPDVSRLLLDVLRDSREFDLARVEAIKVVGIYISESNPLWPELRGELERIATDEGDEMLRGWAEQMLTLPEE